jgi:hypothetical protein
MITNQPLNELFFPKLEVAKERDSSFKAACVKIEKKLEKYALSRGINPDELRLYAVCDAEGELHPKLRLYIERTPKLGKQTDARYRKYKEEICANVKRAVDAVVALITGVSPEDLSNDGKEQVPVLLRHNHPILEELYNLLPQQTIKSPANHSRFQRGGMVTENGCLVYLSCAETLKHCSASSLYQFLSECRPALHNAFKIVCVSFPEKIANLVTITHDVCKKLNVPVMQKRKCVPVEEWPSPIREEMQIYRAVTEGILIEGLEEKLARADVTIKIKDRLRPAAVRSAEATVELLLHRYCPGRERVSVRDLLTTTVSEEVEADGKKRFVYYNKVLSPYRESERARSDESKRAGYDSKSFSHAATYLLSLAAYNGIFEYHEVIRRAFKLKFDVERIEERKAEKKSIIKRQVLDEWIEDNWPEYERILTQGLFKRDKAKRGHNEADRSMRFVLHYCRVTTMKVMGYRQRQLRDCVYGMNLVVTPESLEFIFPAGKTKKAKPLRFKAESGNCGNTHGRLIYTLYLFHRYAFPYVQSNLKSQPATGGKRGTDSKDQFFVHLSRGGKLTAFDPARSQPFVSIFKGDCRRFLKHPNLQKEALQLIHPHYLRGAAMDTQIEDNGMSMEAASRYFGATEQVIRSKYKDKKATQDASRDVILLNAEIEDLEERRKRNRGESTAANTSEAEVQELRQQLRESLDRERQKDERIAKLEERLDHMQAAQDIRHGEIMEVLRGGGNGRAGRKGRPKAKAGRPSLRGKH